MFLTKSNTIMCIFLAVFLCVSLDAHEMKSRVTGTLDWERMRIEAKLSVDLDAAKVGPPSGRTQAEEMLFSRYFETVRGVIYSIRLDSSAVIGDLVVSGKIPYSIIDSLALQAERDAPKYSLDFNSISSAYTIDLKNMAAKLMRRTRDIQGSRLINPIPVAEYTGIIVIAQDELPVHGRKSAATLTPCIFPKIWDTEMNLIYDAGINDGAVFTSAYYTSQASIFQDNPSGLDEDLRKVTGDRPLRIIARGIFGINPTDPIIDRSDALTILSSEVNKRLLRDGRVAFIVQADALNREL
jgi:hypothetical protein